MYLYFREQAVVAPSDDLPHSSFCRGYLVEFILNYCFALSIVIEMRSFKFAEVIKYEKKLKLTRPPFDYSGSN